MFISAVSDDGRLTVLSYTYLTHQDEQEQLLLNPS